MPLGERHKEDERIDMKYGFTPFEIRSKAA